MPEHYTRKNARHILLQNKMVAIGQKMGTKFASFPMLYFPHFTTFRDQTLQFYSFLYALSSCGDLFTSAYLVLKLVCNGIVYCHLAFTETFSQNLNLFNRFILLSRELAFLMSGPGKRQWKQIGFLLHQTLYLYREEKTEIPFQSNVIGNIYYPTRTIFKFILVVLRYS